MTAIGDLLTRYNLEDPIKDDTVGKFTSPELQKLYDELVDRAEVRTSVGIVTPLQY